jgi:hypothetical protein
MKKKTAKTTTKKTTSKKKITKKATKKAVSKKSEKLMPVFSHEMLMKLVRGKTFPVNKAPNFIENSIEHFKTDKWPLSYDHVSSEIAFEILKFSPIEYFVGELAKHGVKLGIGQLEDKRLVLYIEK